MQAPFTPLICDRCGSAATAASPRFSFSTGCILYVCADCWVPERELCRGCAQPGLPPPGGLKGAILDTIDPQPRLRALFPHLSPDEARGIELRQTRVEIPKPVSRPSRAPRRLGRAVAAATADLPFRLSIVAILAVAVATGFWMVDMATRGNAGPPTGAVSDATPPPNPSGTSRTSPASPASAASPAGPASAASRSLTEEDFDLLRMGSGPGDGWSVVGPAGSVAVAAQPTAVDRSIRLRSSAKSVQACRAVPGPDTAMAIDVDMLVDAVPSTGAAALTLRQAGRSQFEARLGSGGTMQIAGGGAPVTAVGSVMPYTWYRLSVRYLAGAAIIHVGPREGLATVQSVHLPAEASGGFDSACFGVPAGAVASLYVDNVALAR
jgi:hypothetical protein